MNALVARAVAGDGAALDALCRALEGPVFRLCLRMLGARGDAEDATQEILVKVITHLSEFEGRSAVTTWAHRIAVRHVLALGRDERLALVLVDLLGLDAAEAAEIAEVGHDALRKRLSRARARLEEFMKAKCGIANPAAPCRCDRQVAAKVAHGLTRERAVLSPLTPEGDVVTAAAELRSVRQVFEADGPVAAPAVIRERLRARLPTVLR